MTSVGDRLAFVGFNHLGSVGDVGGVVVGSAASPVLVLRQVTRAVEGDFGQVRERVHHDQGVIGRVVDVGEPPKGGLNAFEEVFGDGALEIQGVFCSVDAYVAEGLVLRAAIHGAARPECVDRPAGGGA